MERASGLVVFFFGAAIVWFGRGLSIGSLRAPGPGFFPAIIAAPLMILALYLIMRGGTKADKVDSASTGFFARTLVVFLALLGYFLLLEFLGFVIISFLFMVFLFLWVARQKWYTALSSAVVCVGLAYLLFEILLKSNFPKGVFGF